MRTVACSRHLLCALALLVVSACGDSPPAQDVADAPSPETAAPDADAPAEDAPPAPAQAPAPAPPIDGWIESMGEALPLAARLERPLLVYVSTDPAGCPAATHMDAGLCTTAGAVALSAEVVPVRLRVDDKLDDVSHRALRGLGLLLLPAVAVLSPEGDVIHRQYAGLYPVFVEKGDLLEGDWAPPLTAKGMLAIVRSAVERHAAVVRLAESRPAGKDAAQQLERAAALVELGRTAKSIALLESVCADKAQVEAGALLAWLLVKASRQADAAARYEALLADHPKHADAGTWGYEAAHLRLAALPPGPGEQRAAADLVIAKLETLYKTARSESVRLRSALSLAERFALEGDEKRLQARLAWLAEQAGTAERAPAVWTARMLFRLASLEMRPGAPALLERSERHYRMLLTGHPDSFEAQQVKHGVIGMLRSMAALPPPPPPGDGR